MKIKGNRKTALIMLVSFVIVCTVVLLLVLTQAFGRKYPQEPLQMKNMGSSDKSLDIGGLKLDTEIKEVPVYLVQQKIHIDLVEKMIDEMGLKLERTDIVENVYIEWVDEENTFYYNAVQDTVSFEIGKNLSLERGQEAFPAIFKKYLGLDYTFKLQKEKKNLDGGITYYASRTLEDIPIEYNSAYEYSEILSFNKEGYLESGQLLLAEIYMYDVYIPLISKSELSKFVNSKVYPKEHYVDTSVLSDILDFDYLDDQWGDIEDSVSDCKAQSSNLIFLYTDSNQGYLLPALKVSSTCKAVYGSSEYSVLTIFYLNATDPKYITR